MNPAGGQPLACGCNAQMRMQARHCGMLQKNFSGQWQQPCTHFYAEGHPKLWGLSGCPNVTDGVFSPQPPLRSVSHFLAAIFFFDGENYIYDIVGPEKTFGVGQPNSPREIFATKQKRTNNAFLLLLYLRRDRNPPGLVHCRDTVLPSHKFPMPFDPNSPVEP